MSRAHRWLMLAAALLAHGALAQDVPTRRSTPAVLRVDTPLEADTTVKTLTRSADVTRDLRVSSTSAEAVKLRAELGPVLRAGDGVLVGDVSWTLAGKDRAALEKEPLALGPRKTAILHFAANLPGDGDYVIPGALLYGTARESFRVLVTRARAATPVEIQPVETVLAGDWRFVSDTEARLSVALKETSGQETPLHLPVLAALTLKDGSGGRFHADFKSFDVRGGAACSQKDALSLRPNGTCVVSAVIRGLRDAGEYEGVLRIASPDATPVEKTFVLLVRRPWWLAALCVALGAVISAGLRGWIGKGRPVAVALRDLLHVDVQLESLRQRPSSDGVTRVAKLLGDRLRAADAQLRFGAQVDAAAIAALATVAEVLLEAADLQAEISAVEPSLRAEAQAVVDGVLGGLEAAKPPAGTELDDLVRARGALEAKLRTWLGNQVAALRAAAGLMQGGAPDFRARLARELDEVTDRTAAGRVREAARAFTAAQRTWFVLRAAALNDTTPEGMNDAETQAFGDVKRKLGTALEAARNGESGSVGHDLDRAVAGYLLLGTQVLDRRVRERAVTPPDPALTLQRVAEVRTLLASSDVSKAEAQYGEALASLAPPPKFRVAAAIPIGLDPARVEPAGRPDPEKLLERLERRTRRRDLVANAFVLFVAVASGLYVLWIPDAKWGSPASILLAFLWGVGLREVGGATFEGLGAFRQRLTAERKAAPAG